LTLFSFHNTAFKLVLMRTDFWFVMLLHIFLCIMYYEVSDNPVLVPSSNGSQQDWPFVSATTIGKGCRSCSNSVSFLLLMLKELRYLLDFLV
jgi:hypothetical protein